MLRRAFDHLMNRHSWMWKYRHLWNKEAIMNQLSEESLNHAHRKFLLKEIEKFEPFDSLLEFGCGAGANLALLADKYPGKHFYGYDIRPKNLMLSALKRNIALVDSVDSVDGVDIVLVDAVFIYIEPVQTEKIIEELKKKAQKAILLFEWTYLKRDIFIGGHWAHNFEKYFPFCTILDSYKIDIFDDFQWQQWGAFITWQK